MKLQELGVLDSGDIYARFDSIATFYTCTPDQLYTFFTSLIKENTQKSETTVISIRCAYCNQTIFTLSEQRKPMPKYCPNCDKPIFFCNAYIENEETMK